MLFLVNFITFSAFSHCFHSYSCFLSLSKLLFFTLPCTTLFFSFCSSFSHISLFNRPANFPVKNGRLPFFNFISRFYVLICFSPVFSLFFLIFVNFQLFTSQHPNRWRHRRYTSFRTTSLNQAYPAPRYSEATHSSIIMESSLALVCHDIIAPTTFPFLQQPK